MKYLVSQISIVNSNGGVIFDPVLEPEIFSTYVSALKHLAFERRINQRIGWPTKVIMNSNRFSLGRQEMLRMVTQCEGITETIYITRISENGIH